MGVRDVLGKLGRSFFGVERSEPFYEEVTEPVELVGRVAHVLKSFGYVVVAHLIVEVQDYGGVCGAGDHLAADECG